MIACDNKSVIALENENIVPGTVVRKVTNEESDRQQNNTEDPVDYTGTEKADTASLLPSGIHNDIPADFACFYS